MPSPTIDWNDLRYFLEAARAKTLAGAARALGVDHSTIGRRLTALEQALGAPLITRGPDGLELTALGERAAPLAAEMERVAQALVETVASQKVRVRLAVPSAFAQFITPHLAEFHAEHPGVILEFLSGSRPVDLKKSEADLAIRSITTDDEDLVARPLGDTGFSLYAAPAYLERHPAPRDPRDLAGHDVLGYDSSLAGTPGAQWLAEHGRGANIIMRSRELSDMLSACAAGLGLAVLPCLLAASEPSLRRLTPEVLGTRKLWLVYRKEALISQPVKEVMELVTTVMRAHGARMAGHE
jgi:DNA-binding transcriptional LysR family regulator